MMTLIGVSAKSQTRPIASDYPLDQRNRAHRTIANNTTNLMLRPVRSSHRNRRLRESPIIGIPITQYRPNSRGSQQYRIMAQG
jgi:hypothetical protein